MSELLKQISVPDNVRKQINTMKRHGVVCPSRIDIYSDRIEIASEDGPRSWSFEDYSSARMAQASLASQFAWVALLTYDDDVNGFIPTTLSVQKKPNQCMGFCSGMYSYAAANEFAKSVVEEITAAISASGSSNEKSRTGNEAIYSVQGVRGRHLAVYEDKAVINVTASLGSFLTGNVSDGQKTIYYSDVIGVQYKPPGVQIGYIQLETASLQMNNKNSNFFNENSFTFDNSSCEQSLIDEVVAYIRKRVDECHQAKSAPAQAASPAKSAAEEILEFKQLLDMGVITQEEFDAKKKQLLGL